MQSVPPRSVAFWAGLVVTYCSPKSLDGPDHAGVVDLDPHALEGLPEVQRRTRRLDSGELDVAAAEVGRVGVRAPWPGRSPRARAARCRGEHDRARAADLGDRQVRGGRHRVAAGQRVELRTVPDTRTESPTATVGAAAGEDEDALAGGRVGVGRRVLDPEAAAEPDVRTAVTMPGTLVTVSPSSGESQPAPWMSWMRSGPGRAGAGVRRRRRWPRRGWAPPPRSRRSCRRCRAWRRAGPRWCSTRPARASSRGSPAPRSRRGPRTRPGRRAGRSAGERGRRR